MVVRKPESHSLDVFTKSKIIKLSIILIFLRPDVYIFDDILSALDGTIGAFITEETILGQLKDKTVIMVTHGLQYLRYSDYIYVMDEGKIIQEGSFKDVEGSELYQKFLQLNKNQVKIQISTKN